MPRASRTPAVAAAERASAQTPDASRARGARTSLPLPLQGFFGCQLVQRATALSKKDRVMLKELSFYHLS